VKVILQSGETDLRLLQAELAVLQEGMHRAIIPTVVMLTLRERVTDRAMQLVHGKEDLYLTTILGLPEEITVKITE